MEKQFLRDAAPHASLPQDPEGHDRGAGRSPEGSSSGAAAPAPGQEEGLTSAERAALAAPSDAGSWSSPFVPGRQGSRARPPALLWAAAIGGSALLLAAAVWLGLLLRSDRAALSMLLALPTVLAFLWGLGLRRRFEAAARVLLALVLFAIPLNLMVMSLWSETRPAVYGAAVFAFGLAYLAARLIGIPWALPTSVAVIVLAVMNLVVRQGYLLAAVAAGPMLEWLLLGMFALAVAAIFLGLVERRQQVDVRLRTGARLGLMVAAWSFAITSSHLFWQHVKALHPILNPQWFGPWAVALAVVLLLAGLGFLRWAATARRPNVAFSIVLLSLAGFWALLGLLVSDYYPAGMLVSLGAVFAVSLVLGLAARDSAAGKPLRAIAAVAWPPLLACAVMMGLSASDRVQLDELIAAQGLFLAAPDSTEAALGFSVGAAMIYVVGLFARPKEGRWTRSVTLVAGLALGVVGCFWLAMLDGSAALALAGNSQAVTIPAVPLMFGLSALLMFTAWRLDWQPAVYLAALGLLVAVGTRAARLSGEPPYAAFDEQTTVCVSMTGLALALLGTALAVIGRPRCSDCIVGRRLPAIQAGRLAKFYSEGLLVMGLAATTLMVLAAVASAAAWRVLISPGSVAILAALAVALLVAALVFRQEDLFGFFGFALLLLAVVGFALAVGIRPYSYGAGQPGTDGAAGGYLFRYATVALAAGLLLAIASVVLARVLRARPGPPGLPERAVASGFAKASAFAKATADKPPDESAKAGLRNFGPALYVSAFAGAVGALVMFPLSPSFTWRGLDLLGVAAILAFMRQHVRHVVTGYAVAAALAAAVFHLALGCCGPDAASVHDAAVLAAGALAVGLVILALLWRQTLLRLGGVSDKEARERSRPFTVVGLTLAVCLAAYLSLQTALAYHRVWSGELLWPALSATFNPAAGLLAWGGVLLAFLLSIWLFRRSVRTFLFYLVGLMATVSAGPVVVHGARHLLSYFICAVAGYGAIHMIVYLWERPYMNLLSRCCLLYRDEANASTTIFTAACFSCFVGAAFAAFHLDTLASLVMLAILTAVFFVWSFLQRRSEFVYPFVLIGIETVLSIWHYVEGPGPWTPLRININALVFAAGAPFWMAIGTALNRLRGPMSLLNLPARQMSVALAFISLGFFIALATCPAWAAAEWGMDDSPERFILGAACGAALIPFFVWAAVSFRRTFYIYFCGLSLLVLLVFFAARIEGLWEAPFARQYWPVAAGLLALALVGLGHLLERQRYVLFGRPMFFSGALYAPLVALGGAASRLAAGDYAVASLACFLSAVALALSAALRPRGLLQVLALLAIAISLAIWFLGGGIRRHLAAADLLPIATAALLAAWLAYGYLRRRRARRK